MNDEELQEIETSEEDKKLEKRVKIRWIIFFASLVILIAACIVVIFILK